MFKKSLKNVSPAVFVYVLVFLTPLSIYNVQTVGDIGLTLANFYTLLLFPVFLYICLVRNRVPNLTIVGYLHLFYIFIIILGALFAIWRYPALRFAGAYFIEFFLVFVYTVFFLRTREQIEKAVYIFIFVGMLNAFMGWIELGAFALYREMLFPPFVKLFEPNPSTKAFGFGYGSLGIPGFMRMFGFTHEGGNYFGPFTLIPLGLAAYGAMQYKKTFFKIIFLFLMITLLVSGSRSGYFGLIVFLLFAYMFIQKRKDAFYPLVVRPYLIAGCILAVATVAYISAQSGFFAGTQKAVTDTTMTISSPLVLLERSNPFVEGAVSGSWYYFQSHLNEALRHGFDNFGLGMGAENFDEYIYNVSNVKYGSHSNFILFIGDTGYWGLLVQIFIVLVTIRYGLKAYLNQPKDASRDQLPFFLTAIFAGLVGTGFVRTHYLDPYSFVVGGMIVKLYLLSCNGKLRSTSS